MAWKKVTKSREISIVPPEAAEIAASFRSAADKIRQLSSPLRSAGAALDSVWEGNAHNLFMDAFRPQPGDLESFADWLESTASKIESIRITTTEMFTETIWESDPIPEEE